MTIDKTEAFIEIDAKEVDLIEALAKENEVQYEFVQHEGLEPVTSVAVILWGSSLAVATVVYLLDRRKGGQVIDLRPHAKSSFYRSTDLQYGLVAIHAEDGELKVEVKEPKGMFGTVIESMANLVRQSAAPDAATLHDSIKKHFGSAVTVVREAT